MRQRLLEFLFGLESAPWDGDSDWKIQWLAMPTGDGVFGAVLLLVLAAVVLWFLLRWEAPRVGWFLRSVLLVLRVAIILGVLAMLLEPVIVLSKKEMVRSHLLVLVDESQSMGLRDAWQNEGNATGFARTLGLKDTDALRQKSRMDLVQSVITTNWLADLAADGDREVHVHPFADRLSEELGTNGLTGPIQFMGQETSLGTAMRQAIEGYRGLPLAGVVIISDGQSNSGEAPRNAAAEAAREGVPVLGIIAGTPEGPRNASIFKFEADPVVFVRDKNQLTVFVQSRGMAETPATVILEKREAGEPWQEVGARDIVLGLEGQLIEVNFDYSEERPGSFEFRARLGDLGPELTTDDNVAMAEVRAIRQKLRVLFIAGSTFPEVQFLRNTLYRDKGIDLSSWNMAADDKYEHMGDNPIRRLPRSQDELNTFDCVILYDPDPRKWPAEFPDMLTRFVAREGGGLIYIAGEMESARLFDNQEDPALAWLSLLPVIRQPGLFRSEVQMRLSARNAWHLDLTEEGLRDPVFQFAEDPQVNARIIRYLPGMYWHFPVTRAKPGATVLARHGDPRMRNEFGPEVLLATQLVGPGRTMFVGFDSTYRWRFLDEQYFDGFWARMVDRAGRAKQLGGVQPFVLTTDRSDYRPGSQVQLTARFRDVSEMDPGIQMLHGEIERAGDDPTPVTLAPSGPAGEFTTNLEVERPGPHTVRVWVGDAAARDIVKAATLRLNVELPNLEYENPSADRAKLESACLPTGGKVFSLDEADQVKDSLKVRRVERILEDRQEVWDAPILYGLIFLLLCAEWILRKRIRMV